MVMFDFPRKTSPKQLCNENYFQGVFVNAVKILVAQKTHAMFDGVNKRSGDDKRV